MEFRTHGEYHIDVLDDVLLIDGKGPFNVEAVKGFEKNIAVALDTLREIDSWYQIVVLHDMSIFTPDALENLTKVNHWRMSLGLKASAVVTGSMVVGKKLAEQQLRTLYSEQGLDHGFFDSLEAAKAWIDTLRSA